MEEGVDHFDRLPDDLLRVIFNRVVDANSLGCCICVSKRFATLVPETKAVSIVFSRLIKYWWKKNNNGSQRGLGLEFEEGNNKYYRPSLSFHKFLPSLDQLSKSFNNQIESLQITLPPTDGLREVQIMFRSPSQIRSQSKSQSHRDCEYSLLKWKAEFGSELKSCVILSSKITSLKTSEKKKESNNNDNIVKLVEEEEGEESSKVDYHSCDKMALLDETIWLLQAASMTHGWLSQMDVIPNGPMLGRIEVVTDDKKLGQGRLCMNQQQIVESRSSERKSFGVPDVHLEFRYAPVLELPTTGKVMEGASLVLVRPFDDDELLFDGDFLEGAFSGDKEEEVLNEAVREMMKKEPSFSSGE